MGERESKNTPRDRSYASGERSSKRERTYSREEKPKRREGSGKRRDSSGHWDDKDVKEERIVRKKDDEPRSQKHGDCDSGRNEGFEEQRRMMMSMVRDRLQPPGRAR